MNNQGILIVGGYGDGMRSFDERPEIEIARTKGLRCEKLDDLEYPTIETHRYRLERIRCNGHDVLLYVWDREIVAVALYRLIAGYRPV